MLFNSYQFAVFFLIVYSLYRISNHRWQNRLLLAASYFFYGSWDWRFLSLIWISTILDYFCGIRIHESIDPKRRKLFLILSVTGNLTILGFFKYFNFFAENLQSLAGVFGFEFDANFIHIVLPVGISFYTFQTMSYTIDIYYKKMKPTYNFLDLSLFIAFFPQLVAGPIERAKSLLPQILAPRKVDLTYFYEGCYLIFWGLFLKVFVADNLAAVVDPVFASEPPYNGVVVLLSLYAFAFQIFCDFAGYSNIARGIGRVMGFDIMVNFNLPYFATNPSDFWKRWHISLSSWLRDYLYIPLGGNKKGKLNTYRNLSLTMLLGGLWHGASWTFVLWGAYQGFLLIVHRLMAPFFALFPVSDSALLKRLWLVLRIVFFFQLVCIGWLIFRAQSITQIRDMLHDLFMNFRIEHGVGIGQYALRMIIFMSLLVLVQFYQYWKKDLMAVYKSNIVVRSLFYYICFILMVLYGVTGGKEFIYFQF